MFPGNHVQLEGDYFSMNKVDASWEVGHVGVSDYKHSYWPLIYQIAKGNEQREIANLLSIAKLGIHVMTLQTKDHDSHGNASNAKLRTHVLIFANSCDDVCHTNEHVTNQDREIANSSVDV